MGAEFTSIHGGDDRRRGRAGCLAGCLEAMAAAACSIKYQKMVMVDDEVDGPPIALRKTLVIVNNYLKASTEFLNNFGTLCEEKLRKVVRLVSIGV